MSASRQFDRLQARLKQNGKEKVRAFGTFASENNECILEWYEVPEPAVADLEECISVPELPDYSLFSHLDIRLDPMCAEWMLGKLSETSETKGWIKFRNDRPFARQFRRK